MFKPSLTRPLLNTTQSTFKTHCLKVSQFDRQVSQRNLITLSHRSQWKKTQSMNKKSFQLASIRSFSSLIPTPESKKEIAPIETEIKTVRTIDAINQDKGLSDFIKRTYLFTGAGVTSTLVLSQGLSMIQTPEMFLPALGIGFLASMGSIFGLSYSSYSVHQKRILVKDQTLREKLIDYWYSRNTKARLASYTGLITGMSLTISPMVSIVNDISWTILPASALISSCVFGGSLLYAIMRPKGALLVWQAPLMGGLFGLVGIGVVGLGSQLIFGPNLFSAALHSIDTYGGIALFTGMTAYDTQKAVDLYEKRDPDHLGCATSLYLDFMNILIRIMEIMAKSKQNK